MQLLHGQWEIAIDPSNCGRAKRWFERRQGAAQPQASVAHCALAQSITWPWSD